MWRVFSFAASRYFLAFSSQETDKVLFHFWPYLKISAFLSILAQALLRAVLGRGQRRRKPSDPTLGKKRQNVFQPPPP